MIYYCTDICRIENNLNLIYDLLPNFRKQKINRLFLTKDKAQSGLAYILLMYATAINGIEVDFKIDGNGKPYDANGNCFFNISHCRDSVACIIGSSPNGIDVESIINQECYDIINNVCNNNEIILLKRSKKPLLEFTKLWTFKESYLKMMGTGIIGDLKKVCYNNCNVFFESKVYEKFVLTYCSINKEELYEVSSDKIIAYVSNRKRDE